MLRPTLTLQALVPALALVAGVSLVHAGEDFVLREYSLPLTDIEEVEIHASVGSLEILPHDGDAVRILLEIESAENGWFRRKRDVSEVELDSDVRGRRLVLRQTEEGTNTEWTVYLPVVARTTIEMGVGDIDAELGATELALKLGVGDVDIVLPAASTGEVDISVGVGEARLRGATDIEHEKAFVSQDVNGRGDGTLDVEIELGVGDVSLTLE